MTLFPLRPFLLHLQAEGIQIRVQDYRRIARALQDNGPWTRRRLRDTLVVLLAKNESQATLVQRRFAAFFGFTGEEDDSGLDEIDVGAFLGDLRGLVDEGLLAKSTSFFDDSRRLAHNLDKIPQSFFEIKKPLLGRLIENKTLHPGGPSLQRHNRYSLFIPWLLRVFIICWLTVGALNIGLTVWDNRTLPQLQWHLYLEQQLPAIGSPPQQPKSSPFIMIDKLPILLNNTWITNIILLTLSICIIFIFCVIFLINLLAKYSDRKNHFSNPLPISDVKKSPYPPIWNEKKSRRFSLAVVGGKPAPLLDEDMLDEAADAIDYFHSNQRESTLDIPDSIKATLAQGGLPALRFHHSKRIRTMLILRNQNADASWNNVAEELAIGIRQRGVPVLYGNFNGSPKYFRVANSSIHYLEDLDDNREAFIILIFSDSRRITHAHAWVDLKQWPHCAWLDYREEHRWPPEHPARRYDLPLYTADTWGIRAALKRFFSEHGTEPQFNDIITYFAISGESSAASLETWLGDALPWAQDCAVLQPLSMGLADALRRQFHPHLPATRLGRLLSLPGTHRSIEGLVFSSPIRRLLKQYFVTHYTLEQQIKVLDFIRHELDKVRPIKEDSLGFLDWQSRRALLSFELGEPVPELAMLVQTPLKSVLSARLQNFGLKENEIPLIKSPNIEALYILSQLPESSLKQFIPKIFQYYIKWEALWMIKPHLKGIAWPQGVAFAPDGNSILSGSWDRGLKLWNTKNGEKIYYFPINPDSIWTVSFSPDGRSILSGSDDYILRLWDINSQKLIRTFTGHLGAVHAAIFAPDGHSVLSGGWGDVLRLWEVRSGKEIRTFRGHAGDVNTVAFAPDGRSVLSGSDDYTVKLWNVNTGKELCTFRGHADRVLSCVFSPDGNTILSGSSDNTLKLWDVNSGKKIHTFRGHSNAVLSVAFAPDGRSVLSGSLDKTLKLWDVDSGREIRSLSGHSKSVRSVAFAPDGKRAVSGDASGTLILWGVK